MEKERKIQIIKAAAKRFDKHGVNKTTLNEIARDLRIGKATIYGYFTSKDDLFFSVLEWEGAQFIEEVRNIFSQADIPLKERFIQYINSKENISQKYKLMIDSLIKVLDEKGLDIELLFVKNLLTNEENLIKSVLSQNASGKELSSFPSFPVFIVLKSWGLYFSSKIHSLSFSGDGLNFNDVNLKILDAFLA